MGRTRTTPSGDHSAAHRPDATALLGEDRPVSYRELDGRADRLAARLRAAGVGPESVVGVLLPRSAAFLAAGLLVLGIAWLLERQRSRLVARMTR
jgi:non-ribosomal peptide synthetase component F